MRPDTHSIGGSADRNRLPDEIRRAACGRWVEVLRAAGVGIGEGELKGTEFWTKNPLRADEEPGSFSINTGSGFYCDFASDDKGDGFDLVRAATGCTFPEAVDRLARACGIPFEERRRKARPPTGCTLDEYAAAKGFDRELLTEVFGLADAKFAGVAAVRMPYLDVDGSEVGMRFRTQLAKGSGPGDDPRFKWAKGSPAKKLTYGLQQAAALASDPLLLVVEGESNAHAAAHQGIRCVGVPGKKLVGPALGKAVAAIAGVAEVLVLLDPDAGGQFDLAVLQSLRDAGFAAPVRAVLMQDAIGVKDLADLHKKHVGAPEAFAADWEKVLAAATEVRLPTPDDPLFEEGSAGGEEPQLSTGEINTADPFHVCVERSVAALTTDAEVFHQAGQLVRIIDTEIALRGAPEKTSEGEPPSPPPTSPQIQPIPPANLRERLSRVVDWVAPNRHGSLKPTHPPTGVVDAVAARGE